ncbi:hypothetical protein GCK32_022396, partial [Trichostrongylus colubriformis]
TSMPPASNTFTGRRSLCINRAAVLMYRCMFQDGMPSETAQAICSVLMGNVLLLFPRLRFCFAHGGGSYPIIAGRVAHGYKVR